VTTVEFAPGGYRCIPAVFQYSAGVAALPGYRIERARFMRPAPLSEGWRRIAAHLTALGRPSAALCACELRSPAPFTEAGFAEFNHTYAAVLRDRGLLTAGVNPVARSNVCPEPAPSLPRLTEPCFHAFCYTVPDAGAAPGFVIAGSGESVEGRDSYAAHTIAPGDTSLAGMRAKANYVLGEMERRMTALGFGWADSTATQVYTVCDIHAFLADEIVARGAARHGLTWHVCRPPVQGLDYEMDCRSVTVERVLPG
jgi:hypothetical protein